MRDLELIRYLRNHMETLWLLSATFAAWSRGTDVKHAMVLFLATKERTAGPLVRILQVFCKASRSIILRV